MSEQGQTAGPPDGGGGGGGGGFMDSLMDNLADAMGLEISNVSIDGEPQVERSVIKCRLSNSGNSESGSVHVYLSVVDVTSSEQLVLSKDYNEDALGEDGSKDLELSLEDFNQLSEDNWAMNGRDYWNLLNDHHRYRFEVYIDGGNGWSDPASVEFGIELDDDGDDDLSEDDDEGGGREEEIERLQERLRDLGFYDGEVDRRFGPKTRDAVRNMQSYYGERDDGRVGRRTRRLIKANDDFAHASGFTY